MYLFCLPLEHKERRKQGSATIHYHCTQQDLSTMEICLALKHREIRDSGVLERIPRTEVKHRSARELGFSSRERFNEKWLADDCGTRIHAVLYIIFI